MGKGGVISRSNPLHAVPSFGITQRNSISPIFPDPPVLYLSDPHDASIPLPPASLYDHSSFVHLATRTRSKWCRKRSHWSCDKPRLQQSIGRRFPRPSITSTLDYPHVISHRFHTDRTANPRKSTSLLLSTPIPSQRQRHRSRLLMSVDIRQSLTSLRFPSRVETVSRSQLSKVHTGDSTRPAET
jgi:hypothetical protein